MPCATPGLWSFQAAQCPTSACPPPCGHCLVPQPISSLSPCRSGLVLVKNPHLDLMEEDVLYHLDLGTKTHNLPAMFGDIKVKSRSKSEAAAPPCTGSAALHPMVLPAHAGPVAAKAPVGWVLAAQLRDSTAKAVWARRLSVLVCFGQKSQQKIILLKTCSSVKPDLILTLSWRTDRGICPKNLDHHLLETRERECHISFG